MEIDKWKQSAQIAQFELETFKKRLFSEFNLNSTLSELSAVLDRKNLLVESMQEVSVAKLKEEIDDWRFKFEAVQKEKCQIESELRGELLHLQGECARLQTEWETAQKLLDPLATENNELRERCKELTDDCKYLNIRCDFSCF